MLGAEWRVAAERLVSAGLLLERRGAFQLRAPDDYPAARVPLRSSSADSFSLIDVASGEVIGTIEAARAYSTVHEGAVYLHLGRSYEVVRARPGGAARDAGAVRRRLVHADQARDA